MSHHPLHQKLWVIKTLLDRCNNIVSEPEDREKEVEHITKAQERCWTIKNVKEQKSQKEKTTEKKEKNTEKSKDMVTLPYVKGVTEPVQRILKHHEIATSVRPHQNIRRILVHPKDKVENSKKIECVYQIPCKSCNHTYIGKTGRTFGTRLELKKDIENITTRRFTRKQKRVSTVIEHKCAITDHADRNNCIIDWEGAKVVDRECNRNARWIKGAIWIRKTTRGDID